MANSFQFCDCKGTVNHDPGCIPAMSDEQLAHRIRRDDTAVHGLPMAASEEVLARLVARTRRLLKTEAEVASLKARLADAERARDEQRREGERAADLGIQGGDSG